jgi:hypothetical protein
VRGDQLRPLGVGAGLAGHRRPLRAQVAQVALRGPAGDEAVRVRGQLGADLLVGDEQQQQDRGVAGECQAGPRAGRVDDDVEIAGAGSVGQPAGPVPGGVPVVLLEPHPGPVAPVPEGTRAAPVTSSGGSRRVGPVPRLAPSVRGGRRTGSFSCTRSTVPRSAIRRASSEACGCG